MQTAGKCEMCGIEMILPGRYVERKAYHTGWLKGVCYGCCKKMDESPAAGKAHEAAQAKAGRLFAKTKGIDVLKEPT